MGRSRYLSIMATAMTAACAHTQQVPVDAYLENNIERLMKEQEETFEVDHGLPPTIQVGGSEFCGRPVADAGGKYCAETDEIYIRPVWSDAEDYDRVMHHELGHRISHLLREKEDILPDYSDQCIATSDKTRPCTYSRITREGIAEYIAEHMLPSGKDYSGIDLNVYTIHVAASENPHQEYPTGYVLVKPIIDTFGEEGIAYLLRNPPDNKRTLKEYQEKAMDALADRNH